VVLGLGFCGSPHAAANPPSACPGQTHAVCVDRADGGHTVHVRLGEDLRVVLAGTTLRWTGPRQVGPHLLRSHGHPTNHAGTLRASYVAVAVGRTTLEASGAPICTPGQACPQFILLWQVRVVVVR